jgi:predicted ATPase
MARLDRLASVKPVAQLGATLGRAFPYALLRAVAQVDEAALQRDLGRLVEAELLYQRGLPPSSTYVFKHALIQDAAYQSLLRATRQHYHQRIARVIEAQFPETVETQPELLAYHYTAAGLPAQAIGYWRRAGERALERSAYAEAITHVTKGLELLTALPETPDRMEHERSLQVALGVSLMNTRGFTAPEVKSAYRRARDLCQQTQDSFQLVPVLFGLWSFYLTRAEYRTALELGDHALRLAESLQDPIALMVARYELGLTCLYSGDIIEARRHLDQGIAVCDRERHGPMVSLGGMDIGVGLPIHRALALWYLGYPDQARGSMQEAITLAQDLSHPFTQAFCFMLAAHHERERRDAQSTRELARAAMAICSQQGCDLPLAWATFDDGWALTEGGHGGEGITQMRQTAASLRAIGADVGASHSLALISEAYGKLGEIDRGLAALADAWTLVHEHDERLVEAELYRVNGDLLVQQARQGPLNDPTAQQRDAEACFQQAIEVARHQQAKSLELRAVLSLSRLWQAQGKIDEARRLLADIYGWFTEGFDTSDLREAKTLLDELGEGDK